MALLGVAWLSAKEAAVLSAWVTEMLGTVGCVKVTCLVTHGLLLYATHVCTPVADSFIAQSFQRSQGL